MFGSLFAILVLPQLTAALPYNHTIEARGQQVSAMRRQGPKTIPTSRAEYSITVTIGTEKMDVQVDTGASKLLLWGEASTSPFAADNPRYEGDGAEQTSEFQAITLASNEYFEGYVWKDSFGVQGVRGTVKKQDLVVGTGGVSLTLGLDNSLTGLMGWGWPDDPTVTPVWLAYLQKVFTRPQFAVYMDDTPPYNGKMTVGGFNSKCMADPRTSSIAWSDVVIPSTQTRPAAWTVILDSISVKGAPLATGEPVLIDTGDEHIAVPKPLADKYYARFLKNRNVVYEKHGRYLAKCDRFPVLDPLTIAIGQKAFIIPEEKLRVPVRDTAGQPTGICAGAVLADKHGDYTLGHPFLSTVYTIFDANLQRPQIGFAKLKANNPCG